MSEETKVRIDVQIIAYIAKCQGVEKTIKELLDFNKDLLKYCPAHKRFRYLFSECWYYICPIRKDTKVQRGVVLRKYKRDDEDIYLFLGEDGRIYDDDTETVMGSKKEQVETYLQEIKDELIQGGELD